MNIIERINPSKYHLLTRVWRNFLQELSCPKMHSEVPWREDHLNWANLGAFERIWCRLRPCLLFFFEFEALPSLRKLDWSASSSGLLLALPSPIFVWSSPFLFLNSLSSISLSFAPLGVSPIKAPFWISQVPFLALFYLLRLSSPP